ncbi:TetR/AcrR family transcriptional regulator [Methylobacterium oryzihabitans]|uniref:TetR/AcrR family transcriptional regulator n=1 Tax=Methylobacterium oryzihabitans TaxID=2499852 RepID=A0A437NYH4_9HYPH|nr:TetR/AcrR family transcriptional regulator [Methylobacterium oryzihabitans]RVU15065.1 TetR/AcrR family transcriptional regulator [Methylobacterium oryzihabitans]
MSPAANAVLDARGAQTARREHILDAAEACFVRNGFHRSTMQDLAREAGMSPGNIYRYFESKEAVVLGLADREHERGCVLIEEMERADDRRGALMSILERYFLQASREMALLRLDLWSEANRNPDIGAMVARIEDEARSWFVETLAALATSPDCDPGALYAAMSIVMKGLVIERALSSDYDPAPGVAQLHALMEAGLAGRLPSAPSPGKEPGR